MKPSARFAWTYAGIVALLFAFYCFPYAENGVSERWFSAYLSAYARMAGTVLWLFDRQVSVIGAEIVGRYSLRIVKNCDAIEANILFAGAALAFPAPVRDRLIVTALGLTGLVTANIVRICSLYYVGIYFPSRFELVHLELWPMVLIALAALQFLGWASWMVRRQDAAVPGAE